MPELPEVETTINGIKHYLLEQKISDVTIRHSQLRYPVPKLLAQHLVGQYLNNITRRGKYILFHFENGILILHLGMSGRLCILLTPTKPQKHDHIDIFFANNISLRFCDPRRFGALLWTDDKYVDNHPLLKHLGKEPLTPTFNAKYLYERAKNKKLAVKSFIMDSKIVVGIGNIYATEALFQAGIHPLRAAGTLSQQEWHTLVVTVKHILKKAIKAGGTTLKDFAKPSGKPGYFSVKLNVYGKQHLPCPRCKTKLNSIRINQRSTVFCSKCQRQY